MGGGGGVSAPPQRNLTREMLQTYQGYAQTAAPYFNIESIFQPKYGQLNLGDLQQQLFGYTVGPGGQITTGQPGGTDWATLGGTAGTPGSTAGTSTPGQPTFHTNARGQLVQDQGPVPGTDLIRIGGKKGTTFTDPYAGASAGAPSQTPGYHPGTLALGAAANTAQRTADIADVLNLGPEATAALVAANPALGALQGRLADSPLLTRLNQEALTGLSGNYLSPQEARAATQAQRAGAEGQGMALTGTPEIAAEILNRDAAFRARQQQERAFGATVEGLNARQTGLVTDATRAFGDPFQMILSRGSGAGSVMQDQRMFDPTSSYASDLYNTNYNAQAAANIASANQQAAKGGGTMQTIGSIAGAVATAY